MNLEEAVALQNDINEMLNTINDYQCLYQTMDKFGYDEAAIVSMGGEALTTSLGILKTEIAGKSDLIKKNIYQANLFTKIKEGLRWLVNKILSFIKWICDGLYKWITTRKKEATSRDVTMLTTIRSFPDSLMVPGMVEYQPFYETIRSLNMAITTLQAYYNATSGQYKNVEEYYNVNTNDIYSGVLDSDTVLNNSISSEFQDPNKFREMFIREIVAGHYRYGYVPTVEGGSVQQPTVIEEPAYVTQLGWEGGTQVKVVENTLKNTIALADKLRSQYQTLKEDLADAQQAMNKNNVDSMYQVYTRLLNITNFLNTCMLKVYEEGILKYNAVYTTMCDNILTNYNVYLKEQADKKH